jgi:hypothetical protein
MVIDGVLGILTLGLRRAALTEWAISGGLNWIYDHEEALEEARREAAKHVADMLGIPENEVIALTPDEANKLGYGLNEAIRINVGNDDISDKEIERAILEGDRLTDEQKGNVN